MAPFAADPISASDNSALEHQAPTNAGAQDDAEDRMRSGCGTIRGFGQRKAIGVVLQTYGPAQGAFEVASERFAVQDDAVGVLEQTSSQRQRAGGANADAGGAPDGAFGHD